MKRLADETADLQRVRIESRSPRKHYGIDVNLEFIEGVHKKDRR